MVILLDEQFIVMLSTSARTHDVSLPRGHRDMVILLDEQFVHTNWVIGASGWLYI